MVLDNKRLSRIDHIALYAFSNTLAGGIGQWLFALKDAGRRDAPVDALGRGAPWFEFLGLDLQRVGRSVGGLWPHNGLAVATRHQKQALADSGGTVVAGAQLAVLNHIAQCFQREFPFLEGVALALWARHVVGT